MPWRRLPFHSSPDRIAGQSGRPRPSVGILLLAAFWPACGTDAVGVGACREIEYARCEAAVECGLIANADECKQFYRDHCLHGVAVEEAPRSVEVRQCVSAIEAAGRCAARKGADTDPDDCDSSSSSPLNGANARQVCDIVEEPERAPDCEFLDYEPEPEPEVSNKDEDVTQDAKDAGAEDGG